MNENNNRNKFVFLTTFDNPFSPFDDFDRWYNFDMLKGYNSCGILDRITVFTPELTHWEQTDYVEQVIDDFIDSNPLELYTKLVIYSPETQVDD